MTEAVVLDGYGPPEVLRLTDIEVGAPGAGQIRVAARYAGVGPTDLAIRSGRLSAAFPAGAGSVLGFEAAGVVESVGAGVTGVLAGDEVAVFLPRLGGYAGLVVADHWVRKPSTVGWAEAAAMPASGEAAVRVLDHLRVGDGETVLVLGAAGSVGTIATQLAVERGAKVVAAVRPADFAVMERLGAATIDYALPLADAVRQVTTRRRRCAHHDKARNAGLREGGPIRVSLAPSVFVGRSPRSAGSSRTARVLEGGMQTRSGFTGDLSATGWCRCRPTVAARGLSRRGPRGRPG